MPLRILRGKSRYRFLAAALVAELLLIPVSQDYSWQVGLLAVVHTGILVSAVYAISQTHRARIIGTLLATPALIRAWTVFAPWITPPAVDTSGLLVTAALYGYVAVLILKDVMTADEITKDTVIGGICTYLLVGFMFAALYMAVWKGDPAAFTNDMLAPDGTIATDRFAYFSFVTLTTLGYGDISPVAPMARSLAIVEAIAGVLYLATFVSRLVSDRKI